VLIRRLKIRGLLSFGPEGIDLPVKNLNVFIGPNASGKSNLLEILALLKAAPSNLPAPVKEMGGVKEWMWKGKAAPAEASVETTFDSAPPQGRQPLRHVLVISEHGGRFEVVDERVENERPYSGKPEPYSFYNFQRGYPVLMDFQENERSLRREVVKPEQSILSQVKDPERYPPPGMVAAAVRSDQAIPQLVVRTKCSAPARAEHSRKFRVPE